MCQDNVNCLGFFLMDTVQNSVYIETGLSFKFPLLECKLPILGYPLLDGRQQAPV